ncbi:FAD-binding oxidoreductase [Verrucomicrobiaceae bacterium N1E253]|uniref:FAD-binding oxidoreductase n=1 Tax=Oceaniferula marina TaxID=2748318 RepID=A0A851GQH9_9BACT|nr:FAD-dependent oxidoreductase [Oceaniferula marina]NWK57080.1 FAD-binding oxidoreductase [Oceaniferula marina]
MAQVDYLVMGQGLAGSCLAMHLLDRGKSVMVVDRKDKGASSRVAAGLVTPLTGKGLNPAWRQDACLHYAEEFYHRLEIRSGRKFYHSQPVVRILGDEKQRGKWLAKDDEVRRWGEMTDRATVEAPWGALRMESGAWLDTKVFLRVAMERLIRHEAWMEGEFSQEDVSFESGWVQWQGVEARRLILCLGAYGLGGDGWFGDLPHRSAKGEVLTLWLDGMDESSRYHADGWIAPRGGGVWKGGANYNWDQLDSIPSEEGKEEVLTKLKRWVPVPFEVIDHEAGVRPIIRNSQPVVGMHPDLESVGFFNGLGSKGSLMAPYVARHFAEYLCGEHQLDPDLDLAAL